jgi:hypothetical protein
MYYDALAYLVILLAVGLTVRYILRQTRSGADAGCDCGGCSACGDHACPARDSTPK